MDNKKKFYETETRNLIRCFTNFQESGENFEKCVEFALDNFVYHSYLDVDPFKVKKRISGFIERFSVQADDDKATKLKELSTKYYDLLGKEEVHQRDTGYAVLSLILQLVGSCDDGDNVLCDNEDANEQDVTNKINWAEYLRDTDQPILFDDSSSTSSESDDDSLDNDSVFITTTVVPGGNDSGVEISPDGGSTSGYIPPMSVFQAHKEVEESNAEARIPYWDSRYRVTKLNSKSSNVNINFTKLWEKHLTEESPIYTPETNVVLNEAVIVRETLWMLQGLKDLYIYPCVNGHYTVLTHAHMKHITENTLQEVLSVFCEPGEIICFLLQFVNESLLDSNRITSKCLTYQAYASTIQYFINEYRTKLTSYEKQVIDKKLVTIIQLQRKLQPQLDELDLLFDIHLKIIENIPENNNLWEHSMVLLDTLWKQLMEYNVWTRSKTTLRILLFLFLTSLRPFMSILERAIMRGPFVDSKAEFFIQRNEKVGILNEMFWDQALSFRSLPVEFAEQFFLKPLFSDILLASKSMQMLHRLHHHYEFYVHSDSVPDFLFNLFLDDFRNLYLSHNFKEEETSEDQLDVAYSKSGHGELSHHFRKLKQIRDKCINVKRHWELCEKLVQIIQNNSSLLLHLVIEQALLPCIQNACHSTSKELIQFLKEKHNLLFHLSVMQKYFLMSKGDIMFSFYSEVFDQMLDHNFRVDLMYINNALAEAVFCSDEKISVKLSLTLNDTNVSSKNQQPLQLFASLKMFYDVGWPVNVILNQESQEKYCQIFGFLLQIKCAKYYLDGLYSYSLEGDGTKAKSLFEQWLSKDAPRSQKMHGMYIMRMRMLLYINGFHSCIMNRGLHSSWVELEEKLDKAESLEDVLNEHRLYLSNLLKHCLFDPTLPYLREKILKLLKLALNFQRFWIAGVDQISVDDLKCIESEFCSCINLLTLYTSKPLVKGKSALLQELANVFIADSPMQPIFL